jgi:outer membrane protein
MAPPFLQGIGDASVNAAMLCHHKSMSKAPLIALAFACFLRAETHSLTLRQTVELALKQSPEIALARLDEEKARQGIQVAHGPFTPRVTAGSGLAYSDGFPVSIAGSAPSVAQAVTTLDIFNRQQSLLVAQAKEDARASGFATANKRDEAAYRVAALYLDAERAARLSELARKDIESRQRVLAAIQAQVQEGRALPLAQKQAELAIAQARQTTLDLEDLRDAAETSLAVALGFPAEDRVQPAQEERAAPPLPSSVDEALETALASNKELRQLQSQSASKQLEIRGDKAARWPRVDLLAQYTMLAKFNNYAEFFNKFQRNNGQIGMSFQVPIFAGASIGAQVAQAEIDINHLKIEMANTRNRIAADLQQSFRDAARSQSAAEVARLDLEVAREQVSVDLAQMQEGRLPMRELEEARVAENAKWIALYDAQYALEKARWNLLRLTGQLTASVEQLR